MTSIIDNDIEAFIVEREAEDATTSYDEILAEVQIDLLADLQQAGMPTYRRPRGYGTRPASGPVDTGAGRGRGH